MSLHVIRRHSRRHSTTSDLTLGLDNRYRFVSRVSYKQSGKHKRVRRIALPDKRRNATSVNRFRFVYDFCDMAALDICMLKTEIVLATQFGPSPNHS